MKTAPLLLALVLTSAVTAEPPAAASRHADVMARGKLEADLGNNRFAIDAFENLSRDTSAPTALRWEALVRLGMARRQSGDHEGSVKAFQEAFTTYGQDPEAIRLLAFAVSGVVPGPERWNAIWKQVRFLVERGPSGTPSLRLLWPDAVASKGGYTGEPISLTLKDASLADVLRRFSDLTGLNVQLDPGEKGTVTMRVTEMPWDEALERILQSQGLTYRLEKGVMRVAR